MLKLLSLVQSIFHIYHFLESRMNIHEYQAKELLRRYGVPVLYGKAIMSAEETGTVAYRDFVLRGISTIVLKSQIHAGGRGKGTVVHSATNQPVEVGGKQVRGVTVIREGNVADKAYQLAKATFGNKLITIQTGEEGKIVNRMFIEEGCSIATEMYISIVLDRGTGRNIIMASTEGGVEIEKVAEETPEKIIREIINPVTGFQQYQARRLAFGLGLTGDGFKNFLSFITKLVTAYDDMDCSMLEVNPLVLTTDGKIIALDAKLNFDDNALYRHAEFNELRDLAEEAPLEVEASKYNLNYIKLDGNVGCMVNGAGLAMATMDIIQIAGGFPANFLDVGGGANVERIANAFRIMMSDSNVKAVLVNIFGGIVRCDRVANGILQALQQVEVNVPVIVRLEGTNAKEAQEILKNSGMEFLVAGNLQDAAQKVTEALTPKVIG
jgi:succinyl-CoA synthetase beta subunit